MEERLSITPGRRGVVAAQPRGFNGVIDIVDRSIRIRFPFLLRMVEAVPNFDLNHDLPLGRQLQEPFKPLPVFIVPLVQIVAAVLEFLVRIDFEAVILPITHRIPHVVPAHLGQFIEMLLEIGDLK